MAVPCHPKQVLQPLQHVEVTTGMLFTTLPSQNPANLSPNRNGVSPTLCKKPIPTTGTDPESKFPPSAVNHQGDNGIREKGMLWQGVDGMFWHPPKQIQTEFNRFATPPSALVLL